jgi:hypothetical protein
MNTKTLKRSSGSGDQAGKTEGFFGAKFGTKFCPGTPHQKLVKNWAMKKSKRTAAGLMLFVANFAQGQSGQPQAQMLSFTPIFLPSIFLPYPIVSRAN